MKYKILATDLDGTLNNDFHQITKGNKEAISQAVKEGMKVLICSGRSPASIEPYAKNAGLAEKGFYGIGFNGCVVYEADTMKIIYEKRLEKENALKIISLIKNAYSSAPVMAYVQQDLIYYETGQEYICGYSDRVNIKREKIEDFNKAVKDDVFKVIICWAPEKLQGIYDAIKDEVGQYGFMFFSSPNLLEFSPLGSDKSTGVKFLADYLNVGMDEVICVGDNYNDLEMVKEAGLGVAVKNAVKELKEAADYITDKDNNEDAVKEVLDMVKGLI